MVYVISKQGIPLMPTTPRKARLLLKAGRAKCAHRTPFTIKLLYETTTYTQPLTLGVDTGSGTIGSAVVDETGNVVYLSEVVIRNDVSTKMTRRAKYRRNRRNRKTRYRKPRWLNRRNSIRTDRFSPTMNSKFNSHEKEIRFVKSLLPITRLILETATFDPHALKNPDVLKNKWLYQRGANYGFSNSKAFALDRDTYKCQRCKGKSKDKRLEVHHIVYRSNGGSDDHENLITLCKTCHDEVHANNIEVGTGSRKGHLAHATQMNSIRIQLLRHQAEAVETFGFVTKEHRQLMGLPKEHYYDAAAIASLSNIERNGLLSVDVKCNLLRKRCIPAGDFQRTKGVRSQLKIPDGKIQGFQKWDKVGYDGGIYFVKGRMTSGYAVLSDIYGTTVKFEHTPKFMDMKRLTGRRTWIIDEKAIQKVS